MRLPDGRTQIVSYVADENGYQADVRYDDEDKTSGNTIEDSKAFVYDEPKSSKNDHSKSNHNDDYYNQYSDSSKEYYNSNDYTDYTDKTSNNYNKRKFAAYDAKNDNDKIGVIVVPNEFKSTSVTPSYEALKPLFVTKKPYKSPSTQNFVYKNIPLELSVPSTTSNPSYYNEGTTERVVIIGTSKTPLYTNIRHSVPSLPVTSPSPLFNSVSPSFLLSTTENPIFAKNVDVSNNKAVLTSNFINRIQKYLTFT